MDIMTAVAEELMNTPPPPSPRPPTEMVFALPPLPTFESSWDFSQFRSRSPQLPSTPSPTRITSVESSPTKRSEVRESPIWTTEKKNMDGFKAPPSSPRFRPVQAMNDQAMRDVCAFASLSLSINHAPKPSTDLSSVPGLTDSFTSSSCSSDDHHSDTDVDEDPYHTNTNQAWNSYYTPVSEEENGQYETCEQSYILPSAESCYALGFGNLGSPASPSPVKNSSPIKRNMRPSPSRTRTAPAPSSVPYQVRPSMSIRRNPSQKSTKSSRTITQSRYNMSTSSSSNSITHTNTSTTTRRLPRVPPPALSLAAALSEIPPPPPPHDLPLRSPTNLPSPPPRTSFARDRRMEKTRNGPRSPPADYTPPYLSLFPMSARHSTPNGETPPWPVPSRRAPRPVTAPAERCDTAVNTSHIAVGLHASTTVLGSAGGVQVVEKSVWESDSDDDEEEEGRKSMGKWHLRTGSSSSRNSGKGSMRAKEVMREKEKWGKRSASDVVRSLFMKHGGH